MTHFLIRTFIKDYKNTQNPDVRKKYGQLAGVVGIISNLLLCSTKIVIGIIIHSIAIIADGINNLADAASSIITLIGFKMAAKPEDKEHPYGHARIEYLSGLLISIIIIFIGFQLLKTSFEKVLHPEVLEFNLTSILILVFAIAIKVWQAAFNISAGKKINSIALIATGTDSRNDVIATTAVLAGILIGKATNLHLDGIMGCGVALFIIWSGIKLIQETASPLLGEAPDPALVEAIFEGVKSREGVLGIHDLVVHSYGPGRTFASIHIEVDADGDLMEIHDMIDNIEKELSDALHIHLVAHMDPVKTNDPIIAELHTVIEAALDSLDGVIGMHDLRVIPGTTHTNIIFDAVISSECKIEESEIKGIVNRRIKEINQTYFAIITFDKAYS
ncbi:cation diffusion facilitator family transporter [Clostridium aminobutyricum]|uniref:Cation transporter n=1 Tax=Clostridium aminobutyricum TaxID=33953 RepID=A0A939D8Z2_CLOAM|nr:cation diffusion facilitator family transporter [Clostridium aminobutyricum]MBN7773285.1 cation transporter [Clostridium aminobutyricum]